MQTAINYRAADSAQTAELKKVTRKVLGNNCNWCMQPAKNDSGRNQHCSHCGVTLYCRKECQVKDWKKGHKFVCSAVTSALWMAGPLGGTRRSYPKKVLRSVRRLFDLPANILHLFLVLHMPSPQDVNRNTIIFKLAWFADEFNSWRLELTAVEAVSHVECSPRFRCPENLQALMNTLDDVPDVTYGEVVTVRVGLAVDFYDYIGETVDGDSSHGRKEHEIFHGNLYINVERNWWTRPNAMTTAQRRTAMTDIRARINEQCFALQG